MPFYVLEKCVSEHVWRFFCEENVTHELIHFEEWKMCVNMFEDFLFPNIVLCEVMHFRDILSVWRINLENKCEVCANTF